jgi:hypothetical protein
VHRQQLFSHKEVSFHLSCPLMSCPILSCPVPKQAYSTIRTHPHLPIKTGRIGPAMDTGILASPGEDMTVGGPTVKTPAGRIIAGRKLGFATTGAAPRDGVRSPNGGAPGTTPGGGPDSGPPGTAGAGAMLVLLILKGSCWDLCAAETGIGIGIGIDGIDGATMSGGRWIN